MLQKEFHPPDVFSELRSDGVTESRFDFFSNFWQNTNTMQKIEKWRIRELEMVLNLLSELLRKGNSSDWANVFAHFQHEAQKIYLKKEYKLDELKRLMANIQSCYSGVRSFNNLLLYHDNAEESTRINQDFIKVRARLFKIISEMDKQSTEYIN
jgi:hypothetical protein